MVTLTPGVLLKLLQSMNSPNPTPILSDHRSPILQITGIAPATSDLWPPSSSIFYLQISDSVNSTYVSLSDRDPDSLSLGQLVHIDRLVPAHPVPRAAGLRPVPFHKRDQPFFGSPAPLAALSDPSDPSVFVIQPTGPDSAPPMVGPGARRATAAAKEDGIEVILSKRRFSSPAGGKITGKRDPSPAGFVRAGSRSSSPVPSKCVVPSLVAAAMEENRWTAREAAIVVPSRYRQPSPVGGRRGSMSPGGRRLSGGLKGSPAAGEGKKKVGIVVAGISRVSDAMMSSGKSVRKSWEENSGGSRESGEGKEKGGGGRSKVDQKAILRTQVAISKRLSDASREQLNNEEEPLKIEKPKTIKKIELSPKEKPNNVTPKITIHDRKWTDGSIPFDTVSENIAKLSKEALLRRNIASLAAAEALEEAMATESVIRCLSMFSDLCSSSKAGNPLPTIDRFLLIYEDAMKWIVISESLVVAHNEAISSDNTKPASKWVEAALATDLEVVTLVNNLDGYPKQKLSEKPSILLVDAPRMSFSKKNYLVSSAKSQAKVLTNTWCRGQNVGETVNFAKSLRREMQIWFMKFVEDALNVGFRLFGEVSEGSCKDNGRVAAVLSQLKRVNDWLDAVGKRKQDEEMVSVEKIERLKRKIYGFVITHVGSAFDNSVSLSKVGLNYQY